MKAETLKKDPEESAEAKQRTSDAVRDSILGDVSKVVIFRGKKTCIKVTAEYTNVLLNGNG